ncbi:MAG TPA: Uma2 family endonuclease [Isosphaeraceae bacterium]|nr:Uma2 family endonuclease [Isosphaeraceae bacterium]
MATATTPSRTRPPQSSGVVFHDVTWDDYEAQLRIVGERPIRVTYDQGTMEVFRPSFGHECDADLLNCMVTVLTEELAISRVGGGTTTHKRQDLGKGAEPDKCYWFGENARRLRGKRQLDLNVDPAPNLVIEVEVTRTSLDRLKIFAALRVPEVWRSDGRSLQFLHLQANGAYRRRTTSRNFPTLRVASVFQFLKQGRTADSTEWIRSFRAFVREKVVRRA